jgi:DNA repair exonuclease SbcCD ATPase subunit
LLRGFDEEGIPLHGKTDAGISALKTTIDRRGQELKRISEELQRQSAELGEQGGEIRGSLGELPQQILGLESQIHEFDRQIDANNIDRLAAGFAAEIFASITRGSDAALQRLSSALGESFAKIAEEPRSALLKRLDSQAISATDSAGIIRPLEQLSTGTRDCFVLAARLALARQASEETSILVLDEPFLSLDEARQSRAVALLRQFQDETGWQIVLMTKEKSLVDKMRAAFAAEQIKEHWLGAA